MTTLTDTLIRNAKPANKPFKLPRENGLILLVNPDGRKWWRFSYTFQGKEKALSLGAYPAVSLKMARERRDDAHRLLAQGSDPSQARKDEKSRRAFEAANTFGQVAREWLAMRADVMAPATLTKAKWMLESFALPSLDARPLAEISPPEILEVLRSVEKRGTLETAHRLRARISEVYRYAIATGRVPSDPCRDLRGALRPKRPTRHHAALIDEKSVGRLMSAIYKYGGSPEVSAALKLAPMLFVRPGELRHARWCEFDLEAEQPAWRFHVKKTRTEHIVPLPKQAVEVLRALHERKGRKKHGGLPAPDYLFPSIQSLIKPMSENTVNGALRRMGFTREEMTGHGFRATARTLLAEQGWNPNAIERQLAHRTAGPLGAAYDRAQYLEERRRMMQAWADYLEQLKRKSEVVTPAPARPDDEACHDGEARPREEVSA